MNLEIKDGVSIDNLVPKLFIAMFSVAEVFNSKSLIPTITSTDEILKDRLKNSFHYEGKAIDVGIKRIPKTIVIKLVELLRQALIKIDRNFQVVLKTDHIHIELDDRSKL